MEDLAKVEQQEWIAVKQLPIIEDQLAELHLQLKNDMEVVRSLAPTDENYKEMKKIRAEWNKRIEALETLRKKIKAQLDEPMKRFESGPYKSLISEMRDAVGQLDGGIKDVERSQKEGKQRELLAYWEEYRQSLGLDAAIADPRRSGIKVGMTVSMKSLKMQAREYLDRIDGDLKMIDTLDNADEVLAEYRVLLNVTEAVRVVADRNKRVEDERIRRLAEEESRRAREAAEKAVDEAIKENEVAVTPTVSVAPEEQEEAQEKILTTAFKVSGTLEMLKELKAFLVNGGYKFESIKEA